MAEPTAGLTPEQITIAKLQAKVAELEGTNKPKKKLTAQELADAAFAGNKHVIKVWVDVATQQHFLHDVSKCTTDNYASLDVVCIENKDRIEAQAKANELWRASNRDRRDRIKTKAEKLGK